MRPQQERFYLVLCHVANLIPIWGLLVGGWLWLTLREESREAAYLARQAMAFHTLMLVGLMCSFGLQLVARLVGVLWTEAGAGLNHVNGVLVRGLIVGYAAVCLYGAAAAWLERPFQYPFVGGWRR